MFKVPTKGTALYVNFPEPPPPSPWGLTLATGAFTTSNSSLCSRIVEWEEHDRARKLIACAKNKGLPGEALKGSLGGGAPPRPSNPDLV